MTQIEMLPAVPQELQVELVPESSSPLSHVGTSWSRIFAFNRGQRLKPKDQASSCELSVTLEPSH